MTDKANNVAQSNGIAPNVEEPADPSVIGELLPVEVHQLRQLEAQAQGQFNRIGQLFVQALSGVNRINAIEAQGQQVLNGIAERLGIEKGTTWQVTPEGRARIVSRPVPGPPSPSEVASAGAAEEPAANEEATPEA